MSQFQQQINIIDPINDPQILAYKLLQEKPELGNFGN